MFTHKPSHASTSAVEHTSPTWSSACQLPLGIGQQNSGLQSCVQFPKASRLSSDHPTPPYLRYKYHL